jgi:hypothetical protein
MNKPIYNTNTDIMGVVKLSNTTFKPHPTPPLTPKQHIPPQPPHQQHNPILQSTQDTKPTQPMSMYDWELDLFGPEESSSNTNNNT